MTKPPNKPTKPKPKPKPNRPRPANLEDAGNGNPPNPPGG